MPEVFPDLDARACHTVRRLCRLFRIERTGGFEHRPIAMVRRLIARRDALIDALIALEPRRHAGAAAGSAALHSSLTELAREVWRSREHVEARIERLRAELERRRSEGPPTGLRERVGGQLIGRG